MIQNEIETLEKDLKRLKDRQKESVESVVKETSRDYYISLKDRAEQVMCLIEGRIYSPYDMQNVYKIEHAKQWKKEVYMDFCWIYERDGYGSPLGFISLLSGLFDATSDMHSKMWISAIKENKETR